MGNNARTRTGVETLASTSDTYRRFFGFLQSLFADNDIPPFARLLRFFIVVFAGVIYGCGTLVAQSSGNGAPTNPCTGVEEYIQLDAQPGTNIWFCINTAWIQQVGGANITSGSAGQIPQLTGAGTLTGISGTSVDGSGNITAHGITASSMTVNGNSSTSGTSTFGNPNSGTYSTNDGNGSESTFGVRSSIHSPNVNNEYYATGFPNGTYDGAYTQTSTYPACTLVQEGHNFYISGTTIYPQTALTVRAIQQPAVGNMVKGNSAIPSSTTITAVGTNTITLSAATTAKLYAGANIEFQSGSTVWWLPVLAPVASGSTTLPVETGANLQWVVYTANDAFNGSGSTNNLLWTVTQSGSLYSLFTAAMTGMPFQLNGLDDNGNSVSVVVTTTQIRGPGYFQTPSSFSSVASGNTISGTGIASGTTISSYSSGALTLSAGTTQALSSGATITITSTANNIITTWTATLTAAASSGATSLTIIPIVPGVAVGQITELSDPGQPSGPMYPMGWLQVWPEFENKTAGIGSFVPSNVECADAVLTWAAGTLATSYPKYSSSLTLRVPAANFTTPIDNTNGAETGDPRQLVGNLCYGLYTKNPNNYTANSVNIIGDGLGSSLFMSQCIMDTDAGMVNIPRTIGTSQGQAVDIENLNLNSLYWAPYAVSAHGGSYGGNFANLSYYQTNTAGTLWGDQTINYTNLIAATYSSGSTTLYVPDIHNVAVGETVTGTNIPGGATVTAITPYQVSNPTTTPNITISAATTGASQATMTATTLATVNSGSWFIPAYIQQPSYQILKHMGASGTGIASGSWVTGTFIGGSWNFYMQYPGYVFLSAATTASIPAGTTITFSGAGVQFSAPANAVLSFPNTTTTVTIPATTSNYSGWFAQSAFYNLGGTVQQTNGLQSPPSGISCSAMTSGSYSGQLECSFPSSSFAANGLMWLVASGTQDEASNRPCKILPYWDMLPTYDNQSGGPQYLADAYYLWNSQLGVDQLEDTNFGFIPLNFSSLTGGNVTGFAGATLDSSTSNYVIPGYYGCSGTISVYGTKGPIQLIGDIVNYLTDDTKVQGFPGSFAFLANWRFDHVHETYNMHPQGNAAYGMMVEQGSHLAWNFGENWMANMEGTQLNQQIYASNFFQSVAPARGFALATLNGEVRKVSATSGNVYFTVDDTYGITFGSCAYDLTTPANISVGTNIAGTINAGTLEGGNGSVHMSAAPMNAFTNDYVLFAQCAPSAGTNVLSVNGLITSGSRAWNGNEEYPVSTPKGSYKTAQLTLADPLFGGMGVQSFQFSFPTGASTTAMFGTLIRDTLTVPSFNGPATAPTSCTIAGWIPSQDGHLTYCSTIGATPVTKI